MNYGMNYVEQWKENEVVRTYEDYKQWKVKLEELWQEWKNGVKYGFDRMQAHRYSNKLYNSLSYCGNEERILNVIRKGVDEHFKVLQDKVEKKIGKIIKIQEVNGNIYSFIGEKDSCNVEVILAGGYNVQRLHTRWIITKNIDR